MNGTKRSIEEVWIARQVDMITNTASVAFLATDQPQPIVEEVMNNFAEYVHAC
jgi:hypothetical protein